MLTGKWVSVMISTVARLGVADHLESGPRSAAELAPLVGALERPLYRLLRASAGFGIFHEMPDGRFAQTPLSAALRTQAVPGMRNMAMMMLDDWHVSSWAELPWCVQTGQAAPVKLYGMPGFEWLSQHPEKAVNFNNAMTDMSQTEAPAIASAYDFSGFRRIVDVGGGLGTLLASILERTPGLRGVLLEMPYLIDKARSAPILAPYRDRCEFVGGSFFDAVPEGADACVMKHILHDWDDEHCVRILKNCRRSMAPGGKLLVVDQVVGPANQPEFAKLMDLEMLVLPGGQERTEQEWADLFAAGGFRLERVIRTQAPQCILEGQ